MAVDEEYIDYDDSDFEDNAGGSNGAAVDPYAGADTCSGYQYVILSVYAGIFFSKDRREEVIEVEEEPEMVSMSGFNDKIPLMTQGQWMKGCPEGGEQSFLFGLYQELSSGECPCPHGCGATVTRKKSDFFALFVSLLGTLCVEGYILNPVQPNFPAYVKHLESIVPMTCSQCSKAFCFACGESSTANHSKVQASLDVDISLFHCANLQGAILGIGLAMLEKSFLDDALEVNAPKSSDRTSRKRRKMEAPSPVHPLFPAADLHDDEDDDEDGFYQSVVVQGKKPKLGTGYAGDAREDVRHKSFSFEVFSLNDS